MRFIHVFEKNTHEKHNLDPFVTRIEPLESPESQLSNGSICFKNGYISKKLMTFLVDEISGPVKTHSVGL